MAVGEAFLSAFLQVLFDRLASRELLEVATKLSLDTDLKKLMLMVSKLNAVLKDAEEKQVKDMAVKLWLDELRDVADDAEDALDEFTTEILRSKLKAETKSSNNFMQQLFNPSNPVGAVFFNMQVASKLKAITERLEQIARQTLELGLRENVGEKPIGSWRNLPTTSLVEDDIFGRAEDAKKLIESLKMDADVGLCVIPLVGLGGIGKTTLAQIVYNDKEVEEHFDLKAWVHVSSDMNLVKVTKAILDSFGEPCDAMNLEPLQNALKSILTMKRFLMVLDDVWSENYREWNVLQLPFRAGANGSKIIVTTRNQTVAKTVGTTPMFHLQQLSDEDCWLLFAHHAFSNLSYAQRSNFEHTGREIAKKCRGLPLAAKALGGLLRSKSDVYEWNYILNSEVWELPHQQCDILPELSLSYHHLPPHLKACFAYCAIFPKGYHFEAEQLVRLWLAEGLVQQRARQVPIEDVGRQYFQDLLSRSFFQHLGGDTYVMHDLLNDLAQAVAGERCLRLEEGTDQKKNSRNARHLSYIQHRHDCLIRFKALTSNSSLRTLLPLACVFENCRITDKATQYLLKSFTRLHVLSLSHYEITEVPDFLGELKHLRYLDLSYTLIKLLPESVASLFNLQTLILRGCCNLDHLPANLGELINLQYLDIRESNLKQLPPHMGRLKNLRMLPYIIVSRDKGCKISELKDLLNLRGDLRISGLEDVDEHTDALEAQMRNKEYLNKLVLEWKQNSDGRLEEDVLDALEPHCNLKELSINHYRGSKFPNWMGDPSFTNLKSLSLNRCKKCRFLPPLGLLVSLKHLDIDGMDAVQSIGPEFYGAQCCSSKPFQSLETLKLKNMSNWKEWICIGVGEFPCLYDLSVENCPNISTEIPKSLLSLKTLEVRNCKELSRFPSLPQIQTLVIEESDDVILDSVMHLTSLKSLHLHSIVGLKFLPYETFQGLTALHDLHIVNCNELQSFFSFHAVERLPPNVCTALRRLIISNCSFTFLWPDDGWMPQLLEYLEIGQCAHLFQLPPRLLSITSLNTLKIIGCSRIGSLPEMESSTGLQNIHIKNCWSLRFLPEGLMHNENLHLEYLEIDGCSFTSFPEGDLPLTLQRLRISNCPRLKELPAGLLQANTALEYLQISGCSISSFPTQSFSSSTTSSSSRLKVLEINNCSDLESLPDSLYNFTCLDRLEITNCPLLRSFPAGGLSPNLTSLSISHCNHLEQLPERLYNNRLLKSLTISHCPGLNSYPEGGLPGNLKELIIVTKFNQPNPLSNCNLHKLTSLKNFQIINN